MTLIENILKKVQSKESLKKYSSPPPELSAEFIQKRVHKKNRRPAVRYPNVRPRVDCRPPPLCPAPMIRNVEAWSRDVTKMFKDNFKLLTNIKAQHFCGGKVDCRWDHPHQQLKEYYTKRKNFLRRVQADNKTIYERILGARPRITTTASLEQCWQRNRQRIVSGAALPFFLFSPDPHENIDPFFLAPAGVTRPRVRLCLRVVGGACLGWLTLELFTETCPLTCQLFTELLRPGKYSYIGSCFFTKVPHLYWSGGDVIHDNGFGCYLQRGRLYPLQAENYHFPHSMPGLVSMRMTCDNEMCGIFNITFKPLPQFDLKNVVFARVVRPSSTYEVMATFGSELSTQPVVRVERAYLVKTRDSATTSCRNKSLELLQQTALLLQSLPAE